MSDYRDSNDPMYGMSRPTAPAFGDRPSVGYVL
jgi:hypothetical protein